MNPVWSPDSQWLAYSRRLDNQFRAIFVYNNQTLLYNSGLDAARFLRFSPGIILTAHLIQHSIETGRELFDFMRGDEAYKYKLGGIDTTIHQLLIQR